MRKKYCFRFYDTKKEIKLGDIVYINDGDECGVVMKILLPCSVDAFDYGLPKGRLNYISGVLSSLFLGMKRRFIVCFEKNKIFVGILICLLVFFSHRLSAAEPYYIGSYEELQLFSKSVENETAHLANARLTQDIVITGKHKPIGSSVMPFQGTFDGNGHVIRWADGAYFDEEECVVGGIFGYVSPRVDTIPTIKDLTITVDTPMFFPYKSVETSKCFGVLVGRMERAHLYNCKVNIRASIRARADYAGGLIGSILFIEKRDSLVDSCRVEVASDATVYFDAYVSGGCVGINESKINNNLNRNVLRDVHVKLLGTFSGDRLVGGLVGENWGIIQRSTVDIYKTISVKTSSKIMGIIGGAVGKSLSSEPELNFCEGVTVHVHEGAKITGAWAGGFVGISQGLDSDCKVNFASLSCLESDSLGMRENEDNQYDSLVGGFTALLNGGHIEKCCVKMHSEATFISTGVDSSLNVEKCTAYVGGFVGALQHGANSKKASIKHCVAQIAGKLINESQGALYVSVFSEHSSERRKKSRDASTSLLMTNNYLIGRSSKQKNVYELPESRELILFPFADTHFLKNGDGFSSSPQGSFIILEKNDILEVSPTQTLYAKGGSGWVKGFFYNSFIDQRFSFEYFVSCPQPIETHVADTVCHFNGLLQYAQIEPSLSHIPYLAIYQKENSTDSYWVKSDGEKGGSMAFSLAGIYGLEIQFLDTQYCSMRQDSFYVEPYRVVNADFMINNLLQTGDDLHPNWATVQALNPLLKIIHHTITFDETQTQGAICFSGNGIGEFPFMFELKKPIQSTKKQGIGFSQVSENVTQVEKDIELGLTLKNLEKVTLKISVTTRACIEATLYDQHSKLTPLANTNHYLVTVSNDSANLKIRLLCLNQFSKEFVTLKILEARNDSAEKVPLLNSTYKLKIVDDSLAFECKPIAQAIDRDSIKVDQPIVLSVQSHLNENVEISDHNSSCFFSDKGGLLAIQNKTVFYTLNHPLFERVNQYGVSDQFLLNCKSSLNAHRNILVRIFSGPCTTENQSVNIDFSAIELNAFERVEKKCPAPYGVYIKPFQKIKHGQAEKIFKMSLSFDENEPKKVILKGSVPLINRALLKRLQKQMSTRDALPKLAEQGGLVSTCGLKMIHRATYRTLVNGKILKQPRMYEVGTVIFSAPKVTNVKMINVMDEQGKIHSYWVVSGEHFGFKYKRANAQQQNLTGYATVVSRVPKGKVETFENGRRKTYTLAQSSNDFVLQTQTETFINGRNGAVIYKIPRTLKERSMSNFDLLLENNTSLCTYPMSLVK